MSGPPVSRRTAVRWIGLSSLAGAAVLGGCDLDPQAPPATATTPAPDHDERLLLAARAELVGLIARLRATAAGASPAGPATLLAALEQAHLTQLAALGGTPPAPSASARPIGPAPRLLARERLAVARFTTWAERAKSGDLARVLAATAAGIRTYLPTKAVR